MTKFTLSTYLMASVLIILSGVLWVLFMQVDKSYEYPILFPEIQREHSEIIQRVYQLPASTRQNNEVITSAIEVTPAQPKTVIKPVPVNQPQQSLPELSNNQNASVWNTATNPDYESNYLLRNNPWSPDYKPGY